MKAETTMDLDTVCQKAKHHFSKLPNKEALLKELNAFEDFMVEDEWDIDALKDPEIKKDYLQSRQDHSRTATIVFNKIHQIINPKRVASLPLTTKQLYKKHRHFTERVTFEKSGSMYSSRDESSITVDRYIPDEYRFLKRLESVSVKNKVAISEYLVTGYHQSGLSIPQYIAQNGLFNELAAKSELSPHSRNINIAVESMRSYLIEYERAVAKPLPSDMRQRLNINRFSDSIGITMNYMIEINNGISSILSKNASYPVQIDVFFVAPDTHQNLNLHSLGGLEGCIHSNADTRRHGAMDGVSDVYHLLRSAAADINKSHGQRFIMLIVRENKDDSSDDTIYIYKPTRNNFIPDGSVISDSVELTYLLNSKSLIVPGLSSNDEGVLGLTHHLHSHECNKVYLSYGDYKSRVFHHNILDRLQSVFNCHNDRRHYIGTNRKTEFMDSYLEFADEKYHQYGEYWFNNAKSYECYEPYWNPQNCRAMGNVFIPKKQPSCTEELNDYIDESFESAEKLYYKMDYTVGMQIVDQQTVYIKFENENQTNICLINTELHKHGKPLYAVIVRNTHKSKQRWKVIDYEHISEAFMTKQQLADKYAIFEVDLPKGSKAEHKGFKALQNRIQVRKELIRNTNWSHIRIVQSKQNLGKLGINNKERDAPSADTVTAATNLNNNKKGIGALEISEKKFKRLAIKSWNEHQEKGKALTPIAHFKFRKNKYHLEKLLPVYIPEHDKYVAISFWYNQMAEKGRTQASGVCLDLTDMKNKANLIEMVPHDSWLNRARESMTINNLTIGSRDTPPTARPRKANNNNNKHKSNKTKNKNKNKNKNNKNKKKNKSAPRTPRMSAAKSLPLTTTAAAANNQSPPIAYVPCKVPTTSVSPVSPMHNAHARYAATTYAPLQAQSIQNMMPPQTQQALVTQVAQPQLMAHTGSYPGVAFQQLLQSHQQYAQSLPNPSNFNITQQAQPQPQAQPQTMPTYYNNNNSQYAAYNNHMQRTNAMMYQHNTINLNYNMNPM